ncbi:MAG: glutamine--fructose-6-phosphate transaminase (isomerizing) [Bacteroidales bacterium]|nr:glutamine--fructose-6-phosphate transaminase (isomerizing) [Bacteroidales bacterium]MBQ4192228.1 glutamine--fructose-6-phosphate transaminase (isomerizing) [Bacteroidales bacterium]MBQ6291596.1 glutamine--fructose-6-phosphate transaminase (isomerizing) [Bacteroidales bacterium]MBR4479596.1 glutamine--fructose-6-phosphate transaminase (isomerizing) [Bacteroidales bacterium]
MCGIVGYIGDRDACPILIKGLRRLEYRGYDSAGVALVGGDGSLNVYKCKGKIDALEHFLADKDTAGTVGIAHTRWATHGEPNDTNAHPHFSADGRIAMIHNGIIENYRVLKDALTAAGVTFRSETDSEVLVNLIEYVRDTEGCTLEEAVRLALKKVVGAYAIAVVEKGNNDKIIAARQSSPMAIGVGKGEYFISSDASSIVEYTHDIVYVEDGEIAVIERGKPLQLVTLDNEEAEYRVTKLDISISDLEKGGYPTFMLKEINEQPRTIVDCIRGRVNADSGRVILSGIRDNIDRWLAARRVVFVACGTSWHASLIGKQLFENICRIPAEVEYASEFRYRNPVLFPDDIVIAVSQSGETADTLAAISLARKAGAFVYGICNVIGSSIARATDSGTYVHVGPEIGVASTKAFTGQVTVMAMMALAIAERKGTVSKEYYDEVAQGLLSLPEKLKEVLELSGQVADLAKIFTYAHNFIYLGRGYNYPTALEGALKLKEISYIHAEGYPAAEMKHGPIALIDAEMPTVAIVTPDVTYEKTLSNIEEVKARGGKVIAVMAKGDATVPGIADYVIEVPAVIDCLMPIIVSVPLQLLAYYIAVYKGRNVDQPRNLAKSVTVE